jgi:hypothetical protein
MFDPGMTRNAMFAPQQHKYIYIYIYHGFASCSAAEYRGIAEYCFCANHYGYDLALWCKYSLMLRVYEVAYDDKIRNCSQKLGAIFEMSLC